MMTVQPLSIAAQLFQMAQQLALLSASQMMMMETLLVPSLARIVMAKPILMRLTVSAATAMARIRIA
jgi:hypothetical protein